ncbi:MAG: hypothetical protein HW416_872 [Chloroflexi bacterium]|nr:hypothetical protein [Chloroflexota bacterium]
MVRIVLQLGCGGGAEKRQVVDNCLPHQLQADFGVSMRQDTSKVPKLAPGYAHVSHFERVRQVTCRIRQRLHSAQYGILRAEILTEGSLIQSAIGASKVALNNVNALHDVSQVNSVVSHSATASPSTRSRIRLSAARSMMSTL